MFWLRYRHILVALALASVISFTLAYMVSSAGDRIPANRYLPGQTNVNSEGGKGTVVRKYSFREQYSLCGHTLPLESPGADLSGLSLEEVRLRYPAGAGWDVTVSAGGMVTITKKVEGLCPADAAHRHLGVLGEYVAVYIGPVGINGGLDRITPVKVSDLPKEWQVLISQGGLGFSSEAELLEALDSLDEYQE